MGAVLECFGVQEKERGSGRFYKSGYKEGMAAGGFGSPVEGTVFWDVLKDREKRRVGGGVIEFQWQGQEISQGRFRKP